VKKRFFPFTAKKRKNTEYSVLPSAENNGIFCFLSVPLPFVFLFSNNIGRVLPIFFSSFLW
jgi:hypothetical protein